MEQKQHYALERKRTNEEQEATWAKASSVKRLKGLSEPPPSSNAEAGGGGKWSKGVFTWAMAVQWWREQAGSTRVRLGCA